MSGWSGVFLSIFLSCIVSAADTNASPRKTDVRPEDLLTRPVGENWTSYNGDYSGTRYSSLSEINVANVGQLSAQWVFHAQNTNRLETTPLVVNGIMFLTAANDAFALDARTGRIVWHHTRRYLMGLSMMRQAISTVESRFGTIACTWRLTTLTFSVSMRARVIRYGIFPTLTGTRTMERPVLRWS